MANFEQNGLQTEAYVDWLEHWRVGAMDWSAGELEFDLESHFNKWHFPFCCGVCKRGEICGVKLFSCKNCRLAHYCSREHQLKAWPIHKQVCKHYLKLYGQKFMDVNPEHIIPLDEESWTQHIRQGMIDVDREAGWKNPFRLQMNNDEWVNQRHCSVCFANSSTYPEVPTLIQCKTCHCLAHCNSLACAERFSELHTTQTCEKYMVGIAVTVMIPQFGGPLCSPSRTPMRTYELPADWVEYFKLKLTDFPDVHSDLLTMPPVLVK